ncbi:MAG TPA: alpha-glucuronidase family glycosyl hydrolase [Burkholderiaceae bacterium]|jgi:alpha-glucuronidase
MKTLLKALAPLLLMLTFSLAQAQTEDGYELWLRYRELPKAERTKLQERSTALVFSAQPSSTVQAAVDELHRGVKGLSGRKPPLEHQLRDGALVLATPASLPSIASLSLPLKKLGEEGYLLRSLTLDGHPITLIAANTDIGLLHGSFAWLRAAQTGANLARLDEVSAPKISLRMLNHWDNPDRSVERGFAGLSIWDWGTLPDVKDTRYVDYARANASLGLNATVLNNVNAKASILTEPYLKKVAQLADILRPYGIRVFLSARFSAPKDLGDLKTTDPLDPAVRAWWKTKADEIYKLVPDFGGFLVKANSEGEPGPQDYGRSHMDGANMMAEALAPHHGLVIWRAFVYSEVNADDRAKQAYAEFVQHDGQFAPNVVIQVKNGAIDFQPREPFHPLFGAMPKTQMAMEFQITKEYLGFATHLAYLGPLFEETLRSDTHVAPGATVAKVIDGSLYNDGRITVMAGVSNIGSDRNWTGSHFDQANWYVFGRMAWDPELSAESVAREWIAQTWGHDPKLMSTVLPMMMGSREAVVDYMTPLGLHHVMATGHHYGPGPWVSDLARPEWNPTYYHKADLKGIGFDRSASGSNAVAQYAPELARTWGDVKTTPPELLLWFHHVPWNYAMPSGRTLWADLIHHYDTGVQTVVKMREQWATLKGVVDPRRHAEVATRLAIQEREARWWRDASIAYFQSINKLPLPAGVVAPASSLAYYESLKFSFAPGHGG